MRRFLVCLEHAGFVWRPSTPRSARSGPYAIKLVHIAYFWTLIWLERPHTKLVCVVSRRFSVVVCRIRDIDRREWCCWGDLIMVWFAFKPTLLKRFLISATSWLGRLSPISTAARACSISSSLLADDQARLFLGLHISQFRLLERSPQYLPGGRPLCDDI